MKTIILIILLAVSGSIYSQNDLFKNSEMNKAEKRILTGKITDCEGNPLSKVTITNTNTKEVVQSDSIGKYSILVSKKDMLALILKGYQYQRISVNKQKKLNIKLKAIQKDPEIMVGKPVIYLYPEKTIDLTLKINFNGELLTTFPKYDKSWNVTAYPDGKIYDKGTNRFYNSLFWDGKYKNQVSLNEGFVVKKEDLIPFLIEKLEFIGLNNQETNDFIQYWLPILEHNKFNLIHFSVNSNYDKYSTNIVYPNPETSLRIMMEYQKLDTPIVIEPQKLVKTKRKGFTIVEWGGCEINSNLAL